MRLKHIKLVGFKSFVDATTVPFPEQMTAIVGPNGCGKSNVIDAVRWVLGESSAKNLRGDAMTDVIFNGSTNRKPVSQASVELVFDNSEGRLQGHLADRSEISVKRAVTKEAVSTYFLNGTKCRRRDITDIFLGTGLGPRSYAIIEQGMISRLIESKPQELRVFLEEAAGISKYKERRRETENRIKHTRENLERLADVREELGTQLEKLKRQAATARRFKQLKQDERKFKAELHALKWHEYNEQLNFHEQQRLIKETELESFIAQQRGGELGIIKLKEQLNSVNEKSQAAQQQVFQTANTITKLEQQIVFEQEKQSQAKEQMASLQASISQSNELIEQERESLAELEEQLLVVEPEQEVLVLQLEQTQEQVEDAEHKYEQQQHNISQRLRELSHAQQSLKIIETKLHHVQLELTRTQQRKTDLTQELSDLQSHAHQDEIAALEVQLSEIEQKRFGLEEQHLEWTQRVAKLVNKRDESQQALTDLEKQQQSFQVKIEQLTLWQKEYEQSKLAQAKGLPEHLDVLGLAINQLDVEPQWQQAVEAMLAQHGSPVLIENFDVLDAMASNELLSISGQLLAQGSCDRETVMPGSLAATISSGDYPAWFNRVAAVNDLARAKEMLQQEDWLFAVLPSGHWLGKNFFGHSSASTQSTDSVFSKLDQIDAFKNAEADIQTQLQLEKVTFEQQQQALKDAQQTLHQIEQDLLNTKSQCQDISLELKLKQQQAQQIKSQQDKIRAEITSLQNQLEQHEYTQQMLQEEQLMAQETELELQQHTEQSEEAKAEAQQLLNNIKSQLEVIKNNYQQNQLKVQALQNQTSHCRSNLSRAEQQQAQMTAKLADLQTSKDVEETSLLLTEQLEEQLQLQLEHEQTLNEFNAQAADIAEQIKTLEQGQTGVMVKLDAMRDDIATIKMESEGARVRAQNMLEVIAGLEVNLKELLDNMPPGANKEEWATNLEKTTASIQRLGAINLAAIEEYDIQAERKGYLDEQFEDLVNALETLESAIRKIDRESRAKFKETYDQVNEGLQTLFPKVFGGGAAYLELTDDDLLETGVTIMARPPGKKNSTIHLLSGGEKALTALSLVFSIFKLNPAPFCMLDEVDAPLDDANVGRFCKLVNEMSDTVQFIYISHNKVAMEMATHLTGVTMQEPGVSRLVAVDIQQAVEMAEAM